MNIEFAGNSIPVELSELFDYVIGGDWGKDPSHNDDKFDFAYCIRGSEFRNWKEQKGKTASLRKIKKSNIISRQLKEGDILIEISGGGPEQPVGRTVLIDKATLSNKPEIPKICTNFLRLARPTKHIDPKYLNLFLTFFYNSGDVVMYQGGSNNLRNLKFNDYLTIEVPLIPLPEQHRIVAKIEELFSSLDKGIESLKTAQEQLKIYRQAVLKWAFEGKLSEAYRQKNISENDAKQELKEIRKEREVWFKSVRKRLKYDAKLSDETLTEIPKEWVWVKIVETVFNTADDIVDGPFGSNLKNSDYVEDAPIPVISISNIEEGFDKKIRYITVEKFETIKRSAVFPGDIIVAKIGSTYGKTGFYPETMPVGVIPANLLRIHPSKHFNKKLLAHYLQSLVFKKRLDKIMKSTAQPAFNVSKFKELPIPYMSLKEQGFILSEIESRLSICEKIEESITTSLQQAEALRESILKEAFEGKLVPQDPNDEPASVLLERIKAGREKRKPNKKTQSKK